MSLAIVRACDVPNLDDRWDERTRRVWPEYNRHGDVLNQFWGRLDNEFAEFQFALYDADTDDIAARGYTIPCSWDGTAEGLPEGIDGVIQQGFEAAGGAANTLSALAIAIVPEHQRRGLSSVMIDHMRALARAHGLSNVIAPVRPTWKERYPLTPIERYAHWQREDGLPFDPWIRTHAGLGGKILRSEPQSLRITGTVAEWEAWTEMRFPESGSYVFPHGLAPLEVETDRDEGRYSEPNVWMQHAATGVRRPPASAARS
jgi:GNAT superfamily N-acetyltransferase